MIIQWIKNIFGVVRPESLIQGAREADDRTRSKSSEAKSGGPGAEEIVKKGLELVGILQQGGQILRRQKIRREVRKTVQAKIAPVYNHPEVVDEVTERITEAALTDSVVRRMFAI